MKPEIAEPTMDQIIQSIAQLDPRARDRVLVSLSPIEETSAIGRELGIPQHRDHGYDGYIHPDWSPDVVRNHRVYFVQSGKVTADGTAPVKIGFSTDIERRMRQLQTAHHEPLKRLACVIGTQAIEAFFHRMFSAQRIRGEWFRLHPRSDISEALARLLEEGLSWW